MQMAAPSTRSCLALSMIPFVRLAVVPLSSITLTAAAQVNPCDAVVEQIADKIRRNGVTQFDLFVVPSDEPTQLKVVGNCNQGRSKILYARGASREVAEPSSPPATMPSARTEPPATPSPPPAPTPSAALRAVAGSSGAAADSLWANGEVRECHFVYPRGWTAGVAADAVSTAVATDAERDEAMRLVRPPARDGLAAADLELRFALRRQRPDETSADVLSRRAWEDIASGSLAPDRAGDLQPDEVAVQAYRGAAPPSRDEWAWARSVASKGVFDQVGLEARREAGGEAPKKVDQFPIRARQVFENTSTLEVSQANVWQEGRRWRVGVALNPEWLSFAMGGALSDRPIYEYRCSVDDAFPRERFKRLCAEFIERSTLGPEFPQRRCGATVAAPGFPGRR